MPADPPQIQRTRDGPLAAWQKDHLHVITNKDGETSPSRRHTMESRAAAWHDRLDRRPLARASEGMNTYLLPPG